MNRKRVPEDHRLLVAGVCTFRRPESLRRCLEHLAVAVAFANQPQTSYAVVVVDNDGTDPEIEALIRGIDFPPELAVRYEIEPEPGISAARNRVFAIAEVINATHLAMLDDDEWPTSEWLQQLIQTMDNSGASVVGGPVDPVFPSERSDLQMYARYWSVMPQLMDGRPFVFCTCNFLIDLRKISQIPRPLFDSRFGLSGGGDTVFFRRLFQRGLPMAWATDALVREEVPPSRASIRWIRTRRYRVGNHAAQWESLDGNALRSILKSIGLLVRLPIYPLFRREPESPLMGWLLEYEKVRGRFSAHIGGRVMEYARSQASNRVHTR